MSGTVSGINVNNEGSGATSITTVGAVTAGPNSGNTGIRVENTTSATGVMEITTGPGTVSGANGIDAENNAGALIIDVGGDVTATGGNGIIADSGSLATDITISTATGTSVSGTVVGILAENTGVGDISITTNGDVTGGIVQGIRAINGGGAITVKSYGDVTTAATADGIYVYGQTGSTGDITIITGESTNGVSGGSAGISIRGDGSGDVIVNAQGDVSGGIGDGIFANVSGDNLSITTGSSSEVSSTSDHGINGRLLGGGLLEMRVRGDVTALGSGTFGILATSDGDTQTLSTYAGSTVTAASNGVNASHNGSGAMTINVGGVIDSGNNAIYATSGTASEINVTTGVGSIVGMTTGGRSSTNGIHVRNTAGTSSNIIVNGEVTGSSFNGIYGFSNGGAMNVTVNKSGTVNADGNDATDSAIRIGAGTTGAANLTVAGTLNAPNSGYAVRFDQSAGQDDRLEIHSTAKINGTVLAGGGDDTLAFGGGGTGTFDLDAIDTGANTQQYRDFETFEVDSGTWRFSGGTTQAFTVNGGTLKGTGTFGDLTVNGGTIAPGNSIGTMTVNGAFTLGGGSIYEVEVDAGGNSDKVIVNGAVNLTGATLKVLAASGNYDPTTDYTIIENDGTDAVKGKFATVSTNLAFLTPEVNYAAGDGNDVVLTLLRTVSADGGVVTFKDIAKTKNEKAVAGALDKFPTSNPLFLSVLTQTEAGARQAFNALSGEIHATVAGTLVDDSRYAREAVLGRMMQASHAGQALGSGGPQVASYDAGAMRLGGNFVGEETAAEPVAQPLAFWTQGYGAWGTFDGDGNAATADRNLGGFISGMDASVGGSWRVGLATGASFSDVSVDRRYSGANTSTYHLGGYVNGDIEGFALRGGGLWAWSEIETSRAVVFPTFFERQKADYDADTGQLFGEVAYPTQMGGIELEPFGGFAYVSLESGGFREKGGAQSSLRTSGIDQGVGYTTVGLRAAKTMMWGQMHITPHIEAAWLHAFDDVTPGASLAFATTGIGFDIDGVPLAEDSALLDAGLDLAVTDRLSAGVSYQGQYADSVSDNAIKGRLTWLFN
ncbi:autotransporter domain-containing protein [Methyloceanibacter sp. wino2]|uniref:autotransporter outer membrane beta-barrel domain-containing protein n=1 Tax=Methyloceanibacter sp. wino2 TaxID=2170729 RepID=UPI000D3E6B3C|nr:autotransporter domain-containing protein [Methyloceanibacter sp. wino2]